MSVTDKNSFDLDSMGTGSVGSRLILWVNRSLLLQNAHFNTTALSYSGCSS
jgi:hypothetical protein